MSNKPILAMLSKTLFVLMLYAKYKGKKVYKRRYRQRDFIAKALVTAYGKQR